MTSGEGRLLLVAPTGRDGTLMCELLEQYKIGCRVCPSVRDACEQTQVGVGAMILAEEALIAGALEQLRELFAGQPRWSDIPVILLTSNGNRIQAAGQALLEQKGVRGNLVIVERPVRRLTLRAAVEAALHTRSRQYELRDHLQEVARNEERLRLFQKTESIGMLAGGIAHDFNNLLTGVMGNASLALGALPPDSPVCELLQDVIQASERASQLTRQLLAYSGKGRLLLERLDLSRQVREILGMTATLIPSQVSLRLELAEGLPWIEGDGAQIQQVVMNLVMNGVESIADGGAGTVVVKTSSENVNAAQINNLLFETTAGPGAYVVLEVADTGMGMDAETQARIFDPFFTTKFIGRGLGLAAVMGIVRGHLGTMQIESAPGRGSVFRVLLPALTTGQARSRAARIS